MDLANAYIILLALLAVASVGMFVQMRHMACSLDSLIVWWHDVAMSAILPEDPDPGAQGDGGADPEGTMASYGCTNAGLPNCNCLRIVGPNGSTHVDKLIVTAKDSTGNHTGTFQVWVKPPGAPGFHLFLRSVSTTITNGDNPWTWSKGWGFVSGTVVEGGFKLSTGDWFDDGPAALTVHA